MMMVEMPVVLVMREKTTDCLQAFASRQLKQEFKDLKQETLPKLSMLSST